MGVTVHLIALLIVCHLNYRMGGSSCPETFTPPSSASALVVPAGWSAPGPVTGGLAGSTWASPTATPVHSPASTRTPTSTPSPTTVTDCVVTGTETTAGVAYPFTYEGSCSVAEALALQLTPPGVVTTNTFAVTGP
jgi:hypothetical protein